MVIKITLDFRIVIESVGAKDNIKRKPISGSSAGRVFLVIQPSVICYGRKNSRADFRDGIWEVS